MPDIPISIKPSILIIEDSIDLVELLKRRFESEHNLYFTQDGNQEGACVKKRSLSCRWNMRPSLPL